MFSYKGINHTRLNSQGGWNEIWEVRWGRSSEEVCESIWSEGPNVTSVSWKKHIYHNEDKKICQMEFKIYESCLLITQI